MIRTQPFTEPRINDRGGNLSLRWYVEFYYVHPQLGKPQRFRIYADLASYTAKRHRSMAARRLRKALLEALIEGWSPFGGKSELSFDWQSWEPPKQPVAFAWGVVPQNQSAAVVSSPADQPPQKTESALLLVLQRAHHERCKGVKAKTVTQYNGYFAHVLAFVKAQALQDTPVHDFGVTQAKALMDYVGSRGVANKTRNKYLQYYRGIFQLLVDEDLAAQNPFEKVRKLKQTTQGYLPYSDAQVQELLAYLKAHDRPLYHFVCCMYYAFLRPKEIRMLRVRDVDFKKRVIRVPAEVGKTGMRYVDINKPFAEMLDSEGLIWEDSDALLIPAQLGTNRPFSDNGAARRHREALDRLGYSKEYKLYAWKHSGVIAAYNSGLDVLTIKQMCGHSSVQMTDIYLSNIGLVRSPQAKEGDW